VARVAILGATTDEIEQSRQQTRGLWLAAVGPRLPVPQWVSDPDVDGCSGDWQARGGRSSCGRRGGYVVERVGTCHRSRAQSHNRQGFAEHKRCGVSCRESEASPFTVALRTELPAVVGSINAISSPALLRSFSPPPYGRSETPQGLVITTARRPKARALKELFEPECVVTSSAPSPPRRPSHTVLASCGRPCRILQRLACAILECCDRHRKI
jgi:hypothetical protein